MGDAFKCDGCDDLFAGDPTITAAFQKPIETDHTSFDAGEVVELCSECTESAVDAVYREMPTAGDTTYDQEKSNSDREWNIDAVKCPNCGNRYPADYSRCDECGTPNK